MPWTSSNSSVFEPLSESTLAIRTLSPTANAYKNYADTLGSSPIRVQISLTSKDDSGLGLLWVGMSDRIGTAQNIQQGIWAKFYVAANSISLDFTDGIRPDQATDINPTTIILQVPKDYYLEFKPDGNTRVQISLFGSSSFINPIITWIHSGAPANFRYLSILSYTTGKMTGGIIDLTSGTSPKVQIPSAPVLSASSQGELNKTLHWNVPSGATSLNLERSINNGSYSVLISNLSPTDITQIPIVLNSNTVYKYRMNASNSAGTSPYSNEVTINTTITTTPPPPTAPVAPNLSASITATGKIFVASNVVSGATAYNFEVKTPSATNFVSLGDTTNNFEDYQPVGNGIYQFQARAKNSSGYSAYSNMVSVTINIVTPDPTITNYVMNVMANGINVRLISDTNYANVDVNSSFQFPARAFCEQTLLMSLPNVPTTLTAIYIGITSQAENETASATAISNQYGTPTTPPPTTPKKGINIIGLLVGGLGGSLILDMILPKKKVKYYSKLRRLRNAK